jgi:hypothetical protein
MTIRGSAMGRSRASELERMVYVRLGAAVEDQVRQPAHQSPGDQHRLPEQ